MAATRIGGRQSSKKFGMASKTLNRLGKTPVADKNLLINGHH